MKHRTRWVASLQRPHQPTRIVVGPYTSQLFHPPRWLDIRVAWGRSSASPPRTFLVHSSTLDFETGSESRPKKLDVFLRLNPKALRSTAITLSSREPLLVPHKFKSLKNAKTSVVGSTVGRKTQFRGAHHLSLIRTPSLRRSCPDKHSSVSPPLSVPVYE